MLKPNLKRHSRRDAISFKQMFAILLVLFLVPQCKGQGTVTFRFEGQPPGTMSGGLGTYTENGMRFTVIAPGGIFLSGGGVAGYPNNGTGYLHTPDNGVWFGPTNTFPSSAAFNLVSLDAAQFVSGAAPYSFTVIGYKPMAGTVTNIFTFDGVSDGTGPLQDFQTFTLGPEFTDLFRVDIYGRFALDNVVTTSAVPEPGAVCLVALGCGCGVMWVRRKQRRDYHIVK